MKRTNEIAEDLMKIMPVFIRKIHSGAIGQMSLSPAQLFVLSVVKEKGVCRIGDISQDLEITPPTATGLVDRLVRDGYLERCADDNDRRVVNVSFTKKGKSYINNLLNQKREQTKKILNMLSLEEQESHLRIMKKIMEGFRKTALCVFVGMLFCSSAVFAQESVAKGVSVDIHKISLEEISRLALTNNFDIQIAQYDSLIAKTKEDVATSIYDAMLEADIKYENDKKKPVSSVSPTQTKTNDYNLGLSKKLPSGTTLEFDMTNSREWSQGGASVPLAHETTMGVTVKQDLGKNFFGLKDRGEIKITFLDVANKEYTSLDSIENDLADVQKAYWELVLRKEHVLIQEDMVEQAKTLYELNAEKHKDGLVEVPELIASEANYKQRQNELLLARNQVKAQENALKLFLNIADENVSLEPTEFLTLQNLICDLKSAMKFAFEKRRDYKKAKNTVESKNIALSLNQNDLWPEINLEATFARNGLGDHFSKSAQAVTDESNPYFYTGLSVSVPLANTEAKAELKKAELEKAQALMALKKTERVVATDIMDRVRDCRTYQSVAENDQGVSDLQKEKLAAEQKRFNSGRSDTDTLIRFQEDVIQARKTAVESKYRYMASLIDLDVAMAALLDKYWEE